MSTFKIILLAVFVTTFIRLMYEESKEDKDNMD